MPEADHERRSSTVVRRARAGAYLALREALTLAAVLLVVGGVAAAFTWPWLPKPPIGGEHLATYAPLRDGEARLLVRLDGDGEVQGWQGQNTRLIPGLRVSTDLRSAFSDAVQAALKRPGETSTPDGEWERRLAGITIVETRTYELSADGKVDEAWLYSVRDDLGDRYLGSYFPRVDRDFMASPPVLAMPGAPEVGASVRSEGTLGIAQYTWDVTLLSAGPYDGAAGRFGDCLQYETVAVSTLPTETTRTLSRDWYCAGLGWVEGQLLEADGTLKQRTVWFGASPGLAAQMPLPPGLPAVEHDLAPAEPERWRMSRLGRARATGESSETTILPTWLPTEPPLLLAAGFAGDLVAFDTFTTGASPRWRFHAGGTVYGQPAYDHTTGRIYFGAGDKRIYAVDARGLFLWSFETADNVAARPLVVPAPSTPRPPPPQAGEGEAQGRGSLVVVAGEDGTVYGLDAATGRERWSFAAGSGIVSWPALADGTIVVGSDGGEVFGIDPATGEERWKLAAGGAIEAPIVVDAEAGKAYVASRDGSLTAFKPSGCTETCEADWSVEPGAALRNAPLVAGDRVVVVDEDGALIAVRREDGKRLWSLSGPRYVGAPILVGAAIVVATAPGTVERISLDGTRLGDWDARAATNPTDGEPGFAYGPVLGGDAIWLGDDQAVVRRLGAPPIGEIPGLTLAWAAQAGRPPFTANQLRTSATEHDGKAIVIDLARNVFAVDPTTGNATRLIELPGEGAPSPIDQVVAGDTLITINGRTMQALDLSNTQLLWQGVAPGTTIRPPVVAGQTVLWANAAEGQGSLLALDLASGTMRWNVALGPVSQVGGVVGDGDRAYTSTPPAAWDLQSGSPLWQAPLPGVSMGGPTLAPDGETLYVGGINAAGDDGMVAALSAATGAVIWQVDLEDAVMFPLDRLWAVDGLVVVPDVTGKVIVLDAETGDERWRFSPPIDRLGTITVDRGGVWFMLENARLYGLDLATGRPVARLAELDLNLNGQGLTQRPVFVGDRLIFPAGLMLLGLELPEDAP